MKPIIKFTSHFKIQNNKNVDFFDIPLDQDVEAFIDPFLIANNRHNPVYDAVYDQMELFLKKLNRDFILPNERDNSISFLSHLHEPNEYHLGYSSNNKGKAIGKPRAEIIFDALRNNRFAKQAISITNEAHNVLLLVKGIGQDIMSDVIANVCRNVFAEYTKEQCLIHGVPIYSTQLHFYNTTLQEWQSHDFTLPAYKGKPIILIPKNLISGQRAYTNYYNWFIAKNYLSIDILNDKDKTDQSNSFISVLKDGTRKAIIKLIYKVYSKPKEDLIDFVLSYNGSLLGFQEYAKQNYPELNLSDLS